MKVSQPHGNQLDRGISGVFSFEKKQYALMAGITTTGYSVWRTQTNELTRCVGEDTSAGNGNLLHGTNALSCIREVGEVPICRQTFWRQPL